MAQTLNLSKKKFNDQTCDLPSIYSSKTPSSLENSYVTSQSYSDDSFLSNSQEIKRNHQYIKHSSKSNRNDDHITSLKRRVRKQQSRQNQNQETNFQLPSSTDLFLLSYSQQPMTSGHDQTKKSYCVVPLPPLINNPRVGRTRVRGIKLNMYGY